MNKLVIKAFTGLFFLTIALGLALFLSAGTVHYWQAWVYLCVFFTVTAAITFYLVQKDKALLQRRVAAGPGAEKETAQKLIQSVAQIAFIAFFIVSGLDHRFIWSSVPLYIVIAGDAMVAAGLYIVFRVFKENTFTSATIEIAGDQEVISSGPYAVVRHPMYSGALLMLAGTPLALGSWWALIAFPPMFMVIIFRLLDEEKFLLRNLNGYRDYAVKVHRRLMPGIF